MDSRQRRELDEHITRSDDQDETEPLEELDTELLSSADFPNRTIAKLTELASAMGIEWTISQRKDDNLFGLSVVFPEHMVPRGSSSHSAYKRLDQAFEGLARVIGQWVWPEGAGVYFTAERLAAAVSAHTINEIITRFGKTPRSHLSIIASMDKGLTALVRRLEWAGNAASPNEYLPTCPECRGLQTDLPSTRVNDLPGRGHVRGCQLGLLINNLDRLGDA